MRVLASMRARVQTCRPARRRIAATLAASAVAATAALIATPALAPAGTVALTLTGTLTTPVKLDATTRYILYYLELRSGPSEQRFSVKLTPPPFATVGGGADGRSIDGPTALALQGPGKLGQLVQGPSVILPCSTRESAFPGYATGDAVVDVLLPPDSATVLAVRYDTGRHAPWVDSDFRLTFTVQTHLVGHYRRPSPFAAGATLTAPMSITTAGPTVSGSLAAHLVLSTTPAGATGALTSPPTIAATAAVGIRGRLLPAQADRRVVLQWSRADGPLQTLATVHTDALGRFRSPSWRPPGPGTYALWASYPRQGGGLLPDSTACPARFRVG
jgi:hypothetical protein